MGLRFNVSLEEETGDKKGKESKYIFNYLDLITEHEKKKLGKAAVEGGKNKAKKAGDGSADNPVNLDPYASDDDDQLKAMAARFEKKYGDIKKKKKKRKLDDYADLGYGYDSDDSFIDNTDVHDEIVPENLSTVHGGFYVNAGPLEFKARESADEDSDLEAII